MNLKESFRYQKYLDMLMNEAVCTARAKQLNVDVKKVHHYNKVDPNTQDMEEEIERDKEYTGFDILKLTTALIEEKHALTAAINEAKRLIGFDMDAAIERNKYRFNEIQAMQAILRCSTRKVVESGRAYKFNIEGNQVPYIYDIDVYESENYDRAAIKKEIRDVSAAADEASAMIDAAMVNVVVDHTPKFDVNEPFEDIMLAIVKKS